MHPPTPPHTLPAKQRPTPPPHPRSICEIICIHPDAGEVVVFPRRLARGLNRFWIACTILRAGETQTPEGCCGHLVPVKHRKQRRTIRAIIQDAGISGTKLPAGPNHSAWASGAVSKVLRPSPVFHWENFVYYPSIQSLDIWALCNPPPYSPCPKPRSGGESAASLPSNVWLVSSFWGALGFFFGVGLGFFFKRLSQQNNSVKDIAMANF